ncbi:Phenylacetate-CoA oxygenase, PaaI subunit [Candidatus Paraburkholderia kirkii]|nr:Phenylacetate-CoA oxygenase, PaaI subunit [Candidatus Paraburkholderia kirkii]
MSHEHLAYVLRLADNALILGQRNAEWCSHGPALEEDIAFANMSLDLIGQARLLYTHAATLEAALDGAQKTEDDYAYFRTEREFANYTITELPHFGPLAGTARAERDHAVTIVRNFLYSALMAEVWSALQTSSDAQLAAIASKSIKETRYHLHHARDWLVRLGDGTEESHRHAQAALDYLMPYTREFFVPDAIEQVVAEAGIAPLASALLEAAWCAQVRSALEEATLEAPAEVTHVSTGKLGEHSEHMGYLLAGMQSLARQHPGQAGDDATRQRTRGDRTRLVGARGGARSGDSGGVDPRAGNPARGASRRRWRARGGDHTPTYSGCPAMSQIAEDIGRAMEQAQLGAHRIETVLAPGVDHRLDHRRGAREAAPLRHRAASWRVRSRRAADPLRALQKDEVPCPRCGSTHTEPLAQFGSTRVQGAVSLRGLSRAVRLLQAVLNRVSEPISLKSEPIDMATPQFHPLRIRDVRPETTDAFTVSFEVLPDLREAFRFTQDQFLTLKTHIDGEETRR